MATDGLISELEAQRAQMGTRAAQLASSLEDALAENERLKARVAALESAAKTQAAAQATADAG